jgi:signal transduction histidine kinase
MRLFAPAHNIRFGLIVFVGLVVFCTAQLIWWIIFQMDVNKQLYRYKLDQQTLKIELLTERINNDFRRLAELSGRAIASTDRDPIHLQDCLKNLISDSAVLGFSGVLGDTGAVVAVGSVDSTFYYPLGMGITMFFKPDYPQDLIKKEDGAILFRTSGRNGGENLEWVKNYMFEIAPERLDELAGEARHKTIMFVSEGSFFMLVMLFGAFLIYRTLQKSEDLNLRQTNFIQSVTHEFRTPLTSLRLYLETLESAKFDDTESKNMYAKMLDDCDRLDGMIDNVLEAGRFGKHKYELQLSETDLAGDIEEYLHDLAPYVQRQRGTITVDLADDVRIRSDYHALGRVIRALIDNALKYSPPERRRISIQLAKREKQAILTISDSGVGIPPREQEKIFDRFYRVQTGPMSTVKGTGLGLYLVRHIIEAHGGRIAVSSEGADKGSTFTIKLPLVKT